MDGFAFLIFVIVILNITNITFCGYLNKYNEHEKNKNADVTLSSSGILKNITKHSPTISEKDIYESEIKIIKTAHKEENKILEKTGKCLKDYTLPCPKFWKKITTINENNLCIANSDYNGFCETKQSFDDFTENDKMNFESSCNVEWECKHLSINFCKNKKRDYSETCPYGFITQNDNSCKADTRIYKGMCNGNDTINFTHMNDEEKEEWSIACEAYWPCYEECSVNENLSRCPKNWKEINLYECIPPKYYRGPCKSKKNFKYFTKSMKINFEDICKTKFTCEHNCEKNYEQNCPDNWEMKNGYCLAPITFDLCNKKKLSFENLTIENKKNFEKECLVNWPCKQNNFCEMDWSSECPNDWTKENVKNENKNYICNHPSSYNGSCSNIFLKNNSDQYIKREIASNCDAPWPCIKNKLSHNQPMIVEKNTENGNINTYGDKIDGPITTSGNIFKTHAYVIKDHNKSAFFDIMM